MPDNAIRAEALCFARYLANATPDNWVIELYAKTIQNNNRQTTERDRKLLNFATSNNWSIGLIDSGLALLHPASEFRMRLHLMFAILETCPEYQHLFLPQERNFLYSFHVVFHALRAVLMGVSGYLFLKLIR
jgi:hypothetical protein